MCLALMGSAIFTHYNILYDPCDLEIYAYIVDKSQVRASCVFLLSFTLCLLVTLICSPPPMFHVDACVPLPSDGHVTYGFVLIYQLTFSLAFNLVIIISHFYVSCFLLSTLPFILDLLCLDLCFYRL